MKSFIVVAAVVSMGFANSVYANCHAVVQAVRVNHVQAVHEQPVVVRQVRVERVRNVPVAPVVVARRVVEFVEVPGVHHEVQIVEDNYGNQNVVVRQVQVQRLQKVQKVRSHALNVEVRSLRNVRNSNSVSVQRTVVRNNVRFPLLNRLFGR